jgi:hypothetical protein
MSWRDADRVEWFVERRLQHKGNRPTRLSFEARRAILDAAARGAAANEPPPELDRQNMEKWVARSVDALVREAAEIAQREGGAIGEQEIAMALAGFCEKNPWVPWPFC